MGTERSRAAKRASPWRSFPLLLAVAGCRSESGLQSLVLPPDDAPNPAPIDSPLQIDRIVQATVPTSDVLFIVDNSVSMAQEQDLLAENFPAMLAWFLDSATDYHIGAVTTDMNDPLQSGALREVNGAKWLDPSNPNPEATFAAMVTPGVSGATREQGRAAAYTAIEILGDTTNAGFVRDEASMNIVALSDENDSSEEDPISLEGWIDYLEDFRWSSRLVSFSSIVSPIVGCPNTGSPGTQYIAVTAAIGGLYAPICTEDWSVLLTTLGFISIGVSGEFFLSHLPIVSTLEVSIQAPTSAAPVATEAWTYDAARNSIVFTDEVPELLSVVIVEYVVASSVVD